jgi:hypothetical protein
LNDASSPARRSNRRARKIASTIFENSDGWNVNPAGSLIQRRAPLTGEKLDVIVLTAELVERDVGRRAVDHHDAEQRQRRRRREQPLIGL